MSTYVEIPDQGGAGASAAVDVAVSLSPSNYTVGVSGNNVEGHFEGIDAQLGLKADLVGGVVPVSQLPALAVTSVQVVADIPARDALANVQEGDVSIVLDDGTGNQQSYIYDSTNNWQQLSLTGGIVSVNGQTGSVVLDTDDVNEGVTNLYYTDARVAAAPAVTAIVSADGSVTTHNDVTDAGSGQIITGAERTLLNSATQPGDNISTLTNDSGFISTSDVWQTSAGNITAVNIGDDLDMEGQDIIDVNTVAASVSAQLELQGTSVGAGDVPAFFLKEIATVGGGTTNSLLEVEDDAANTLIRLERGGDLKISDGASIEPVSGAAGITLSFNNTSITGGTVSVPSAGGNSILNVERKIVNSSANFGGDVIFDDDILLDKAGAGFEGDKFRTTGTDVAGRGGLIIDNVGANYSTALTATGTFLLRLRNLGTETFSVAHNGGVTMGYQSTTAAAYSTQGESIVGADPSSNTITVTLSTADKRAGRIIHVKDIGGNAATNNITVQAEGGFTIDGSASLVITVDYGDLTLFSDGTNWYTLT